jgi:hypothetical protein
MNTENGNVNGAVAIQPQIEMFGGLFKADGELAGPARISWLHAVVGQAGLSQ